MYQQKSGLFNISHIWNHQPGVGIHIFWGHDFRAQRYQSQCIRHALIRGNAKKKLGTMALDSACWQALKNIRSYMFWGTTRKNKIDADFGSDMEQIRSSDGMTSGVFLLNVLSCIWNVFWNLWIDWGNPAMIPQNLVGETVISPGNSPCHLELGSLWWDLRRFIMIMIRHSLRGET